jgi:hypothetical protein
MARGDTIVMRLVRTLSLVIFVACLLLMATSHAEEEPGQVIQLRLVWSRSAADRVISEEAGFPPLEIRAELERKDVPEADKEWLLNALRITAARNDRILYTDEGRVIELPQNGLLRWHIATSKNYKYLMLCPLRWDWEAKSRMESIASTPPHDPTFSAERVEVAKRNLEEYELLEKESDFILMDWKGSELWGRHDMPDRVCISDDGRTLVATQRDHHFASASFYDEKGQLVRKAEFPYGAGGNADLSADGSLFVVIAGLASEDGYSTIIAYDREGEMLWQRRVLGKPAVGGDARRIFVSTTGEFVAISLYSAGETYLFNRSGDLVGTFDVVTGWAAYSAADDYAVLIGRGSVRLVKTEEGRVVWGTEGESTERVVMDPKGDFLVLLGRSRSPEDPGECQIEVISRAGERMCRETIKGTTGKWPDCHISVEGSFVMIDTGPVLALYDFTGLR